MAGQCLAIRDYLPPPITLGDGEDWPAYFRDSAPHLLLHTLHTIGNRLEADGSVWASSFFAGGSALELLRFALFEPKVRFTDARSSLLTLRVAALLLPHPEWRILRPLTLDGSGLVMEVFEATDSRGIAIELRFLSEFSIEALKDESQPPELVR
jgi:hypothetical protein